MKKDFASAISEYQKVPEADPGFVIARVELGMTEMERGDLAAADRVLSAVAATDTAIPEAFFGLGEVKARDSLARR